jgi:hypothetical protein
VTYYYFFVSFWKNFRKNSFKVSFYNILIAFVLIHFLRDTLQMFGLKFWLTEIGHHAGLQVSNFLLSLINLTYTRWTELPLIIAEIFLIRRMVKSRKEIIELIAFYDQMRKCFFTEYSYLFEPLY